MNAFSIVGKITEMPVLKETTNGLKTCELPVRVQRNFPNSDGVYENDDMVIEVWRGLAETVSASCKIGDYVGINGRIHSRKYQKDEKVYLNYGFVAEKLIFYVSKQREIHKIRKHIHKKRSESSRFFLFLCLRLTVVEFYY